MSSLVWVYDLSGTQSFALRDLEGLTIEDRIGEVSSLEFYLRAEDPRAGLLLPDTELRWEDRYFRIFELEQTRSSGGAMVRVYAEDLWSDLSRKIRFANYPVLGLTPQAGLELILKGAPGGWVAGDDPDPGGVTLYSREGFDETVLTHVRGWAAVTGYEVLFDSAAKTVTLVDAVGQDRGVGFRYGSNVESIRRRYEPPAATVLYPVGANGLTIDTVNPAGDIFVEDYSWYEAQGLTITEARTKHTKELVLLEEGFLLPLNLFDFATEKIAELAQPIISYECSVVDLTDAVGTPVPFDVGDTVGVRDETFGVDLTTRVVRRVYRPNDPGNDEVELSFLRTTGEEARASRTPDYGSVSILVDKTGADETITSIIDFAEIQFNTTGTSSSVVGGHFVGTATGTGTVEFSFIVDDVVEGPSYAFDFVDAQTVEFSWPTFVADLAAESHTVRWRAQITSGAGTIFLPAEAGRGWLLTTGAFGLGVNSSPNRRFLEALLPYTLEPTTDAFTVLVAPATDLLEGEIVLASTDSTLPTLTERYLLPFQIEDPEFGKLDGLGQLS